MIALKNQENRTVKKRVHFTEEMINPNFFGTIFIQVQFYFNFVI